jgi:uncharacterized membrane protein YqjE
MATQLESEHGASVASLVSGIVHDFRELLAQQLTLFQVEVKNDLRRTVYALIPALACIPLFLVAVFTLAIAAAELLLWAFPEHLARWGAYAIVGGSIALIGLILVFVAKHMLTRFNPLPDQTLEGLKENIQWKTKM